MPPLSFPLKEIGSRTELARRLGVDARAVDLISPLSTPCTSAGCPLPAVRNNPKRKCFLCSQAWFPRKFTLAGTRARNCRGYGLFGPQFLRLYGNSNTPPAVCCCSSPLCEKLGYSHQGMMHLPADPVNCAEALRVLGVTSPNLKAKIVAKPQNYRVAPWHYHQNHRVRNEKGKWFLRKLERYEDGEGNSFEFAPPSADVQSFIDKEIPSLRTDDSLSPWVSRMARLQEQEQSSIVVAVGECDDPGSGDKERGPEGLVTTEVVNIKDAASVTSGDISSSGDKDTIRYKRSSMHCEIAVTAATRKRPHDDESSEDRTSSDTLMDIDEFLQRRGVAKRLKRDSAVTNGGEERAAMEAKDLRSRDPLNAPASPSPPSRKHPEPAVDAGTNVKLNTGNHAPSVSTSGEGDLRACDRGEKEVIAGFEPLNNVPSRGAKCDGLYIVKRALDCFYRENKGAPKERKVAITLSTMMSAAITAKYTLILNIDHQLGRMSDEDGDTCTKYKVDEEWLMDAAREFGWELIDISTDKESTRSNGADEPEKCNNSATGEESLEQSTTFQAKQTGAPGETMCRPSYSSSMKFFPTWEESFYQLVLYQSRNNGSSVISPEDYTNYRNLGNWVRDVRTLYNKRHIMGEGALSVEQLDQISVLKQIGFVFEANISRNGPFAGAKNEKTWKEKYRELDEHLRENNGEYPKCHSKLYQWIAYQRMAHREYQFHLEQLAQKYPNHRPLLPEEMPRRRQEEPLENGMLYVITQERIDKLSQLDGFEWGQAAFQPQVPFEQRLEQYEEFRREKGHGFVPRFYEENPGLGKWVQIIRKHHKIFKSGEGRPSHAMVERMERLEALGFEFSGGPPGRKAKTGTSEDVDMQ